MSIKVPEYVQNLMPYKPGNKLKVGHPSSDFGDFINLASNENPLGPSPAAIEALKNTAKFLSIYPDTGAMELVDFLSRQLGINREKIICGSGSDSLIADIIKAFSDYGDEIITASGTFIGYFVNILKLGRQLIKVPLINYGYDLDGIVKAITPKTSIIFISNPNNPTGSMIKSDEFEYFLSKVPDNVLIVYDEAYSIYASLHDGYPDGLNYNRDNLIILRTLSKSHGLAGLRIGFAIGPENLISTLFKVKLPFEPNIIAQKVAAAAYGDYDFVFQTLKLNTISLERIINKLRDLDIKFVKPFGNFVMAYFNTQQEAEQLTNELYDRGILVRHLVPFGIPNGVRISSGTHTQTDFLIDSLRSIFLKK